MTAMPRFTILHHTGAPGGKDHFDLFLERGGTLRSWRLPRAEFAEKTMAEEASDHDLKYLSYDGKLSGGKGSVAIAETGHYLEDSWGPRAIQVALAGRKLRGRIWLTRIEGEKESAGWLVEDATLPVRRGTAALLREPAPEPPPTPELEPVAQGLDREEHALVALAERYLQAAPVDWEKARTDADLRGRIQASLARWRHPWLEAARRRAQLLDNLARSVAPARPVDEALKKA
jgi:hypothetical protein